MALNPNTLYHLYEKGILDYVPLDVMSGTPAAPLMSMSNPYLDMAQQGNLYQNYGINNDYFQPSGVQSAYAAQTGHYIQPQTQIGSLSQAGGMNTFSGVGIGDLSQNNAAGQFGFNNTIGANSQAGGVNIFGGFTDTQNRLANGYYQTKSFIDRTPKIILGLGAAAIGILGLRYGFKNLFRHKKTANKTSLLSKLNPMNWKLFGKKV